MKGVPFERHPKVRFGIVGTGLRGRSVMNELLSVQGLKLLQSATLYWKKPFVRQNSVESLDKKNPLFTTMALTLLKNLLHEMTLTLFTQPPHGNGTCPLCLRR